MKTFVVELVTTSHVLVRAATPIEAIRRAEAVANRDREFANAKARSVTSS